METTPGGQGGYVLGHSEHELRRLERQGLFLGGLTRDLLMRAGLAPGMRVLDFGSGAGDVSLLAAELVGPTGEVVGIDRAPAALATARARVAARGFHHARFVECDEAGLEALEGGKRFDAVVGRLVLVHQKDVVATLRRVLRHVRPGGVVAFHEIDASAGCWSEPHLPLFERTFQLISNTFIRGGMPADIGVQIARAFDEAQVVSRRIVREGLFESGAESLSYEYFAHVVRTLLPVMERLGLARAVEVDVDTLADRLRAESVGAAASMVPVYLIAAWGRLPG